MFRKIVQLLSAMLCLLMFSSSLANAYDYPFNDPYVATVLSTPPEYAATLPAKIPTEIDSITMFPEREVPGVLWNLDKLSYSYNKQNDPAPLIFLIAGTGASYKSTKMRMMQSAFYEAGFHVVSISSPTFPTFVVSASTSQVPGHLKEDSADIYSVMQAILGKIEDKIEVTEFYLAGYSLGAAQAAFVSQIDEKEKVFNFSKVLMINPPVNLYDSVVIIDRLLEDNIPGGLDNFNAFYQDVIETFSEVYKHGQHVQFNDEFLYKAYLHKKPKLESLKALIGISFRLSSNNMVFASDVTTQAGYVVPKGLVLNRGDIITDYSKVLGRLSFVDYFDGIFLPHFKATDSSMTEEKMIQEMSLKSVEKYLRTSTKIGLIHNADDIIMNPGDIDYLKDVFGSRATIYPNGGHCGNMAYPDNVAAMVGFFQDNTKN